MTERSTGSPQRSFSFGPFVLVPELQLLTEGETQVRVGGRALELLTALVERPGELVSKSELFSRAWPNTFVEHSNLKVNIAALRRALREGQGGVRYIATVSGRGYRFVSAVHTSERDALLRHTASTSSHTHNLPSATSRIVGRDEVIDAVYRQCEATRLVTIVGAGGIGKTTVALAVAERAIPSAEHGVWFVDLATLSDPTLVPSAIATAIRLPVHSANIQTALSAYLKEKSVMLVLDNCEHVIDAVASSAEQILADAAGARILATSREPLRARGEQIYRLSPLETPPDSRELGIADVIAFPAVRLFIERAAACSKDFTADDDQAPAIAEICRKLDGMALAIELAASHVDAFTVREILNLLDDRFRLLKGPRTGPERHQTLAATLDWSYHLLSDTERQLFQRLSVFAGTFGLESACAVGTDDKLDNIAVVEALAGLVSKSLVSAEAGGTETHYRLLDTTRQYALIKLTEHGELDRSRRRHAEHLRAVAERAATEWGTRPAPQWFASYGRKIDDIRSALSWAFAGNRDLPIGIALTVAAMPFWDHLSLVEECRACVEQALESDKDGSLCARDEMKLRTALGTALLHTRGPLPEVKQVWTRALQLAEQLDDGEYQLRCLWGLCDYHTWTGDHRSALAIVERIRAVAIARRDFAASVNIDRQAGTALRYLGDFAGARDHLERMINRYVPPLVQADIARFQFDPRLAARGTLANVLWLQGYPDQAIQTARGQLAEAQATGHALALCNALVHTACPIALFVGDLATAERLLAMIEDHVARHAMTVWAAMGRCLRGEWLLKRGDASGLPIFRDALQELFDVGMRMRYPAHLANLAEGLAAHGEVEAARVAIDDAIALSASTAEVWCMPELLRIKGDVLCSAEATCAAAEEHYLQALEWARRQGGASWELRTAISLAGLWHRSGKHEQAERVLSSAYSRFGEGFGTRDVRKARWFLDDMRRVRGRRTVATISTRARRPVACPAANDVYPTVKVDGESDSNP
ncbi:MAG: transcriptional regulator [Xanthobacteraceae bacterium]|nr:transcriptional regulator [Xanthobacteraceae bacterium]